MKSKKLCEELNFIRSAPEKELIAQIKASRFSHVTAEKELIKRGFTSAIEVYMRLYGFRSGARIAIFRSNELKWINMLLALEEGHIEPLQEFFAYGNYLFIWTLIHNETDEKSIAEVFPEQPLIEQKDYQTLMRKNRQGGLSPFAKLELIRRNVPFITELLIAEGRLNEREKLAVMEYADWDVINFLIENETKPARKQMYEEMKLIRFAHHGKLEKFIDHQRFSKNAERFFLMYGEFSLLVRYIKHYNIKNGSEVIINRAEPKEILGYLSKNQLCEKGEKLLLKRNKHREIKAYIKGHYFSEENEVRFIKRGRHNEIMLYLSRHSLCDTAQQELMYRRNSEEIAYYVSHYPLADVAEKAFLKCAPAEVIRHWQDTPALEQVM